MAEKAAMLKLLLTGQAQQAERSLKLSSDARVKFVVDAHLPRRADWCVVRAAGAQPGGDRSGVGQPHAGGAGPAGGQASGVIAPAYAGSTAPVRRSISRHLKK